MSAGGAPLTIEDFRPRLGCTFVVGAEGETAALTLVEAISLADSGREGGAFQLEFAGPLQPVLPQATYAFPLGDARTDIFIVPIGPKQESMRYEAIFF